MKKIEWTPEKVAGLATDRLKNLRENAIKYVETELVSLCDAELELRLPPKKASRTKAFRPSHDGRSVLGFHFVCERDWGVTTHREGTFSTRSWVVAEMHAEQAVKIGAYIALHERKSDPSYRQGVIVGWCTALRETEYAEGHPVRIESGIEFLVRPTEEPYSWIGDGSGEKGYKWSD